jgi:hypothetical protein
VDFASIGAFMDQRIRAFLLAILVGVLFLPSSSVAALAFPVLPSSFYGVVQYGSGNVADGTLVEAVIGDQVLASATTRTYQGSSVYSIDVRGDDSETTAVDGGRDGDRVQFRVGGVLAKETGIWHGGTNAALNLSVPASAALKGPQPTQKPAPSQTAVPTRQSYPSTQVTVSALPSETRTAAAPTSLALDAPGNAVKTGTTGWIISSTAAPKTGNGSLPTQVLVSTAAAQNIRAEIDLAAEDDTDHRTKLATFGVLLLIGLMGVVWFRARK